MAVKQVDPELGIPLKGSLRKVPFSKVVRQLSRTESTGSLYLLSGDTKKVVFFESGQPIFVRSNVLSECLGQILAREGLITQEQCDQTLEAIRRTGKKQGELLVEMGILSEGNLRYGLEAQLRHKLFEIFGWEEGRYQFKRGGESQDYGLRFKTKAPGIILSALLETCPEDRAAASFTSVLDRFPVAPAEIEPGLLDLLPNESHFVACLDGSRHLREVLEEQQESSGVAENLSVLLYALIQAGIVKLAKTRREPRPKPPPPDDGKSLSDADLLPGYAPTRAITDYEDTPLPGQLPNRPDAMPNDDDDGFEGVNTTGEYEEADAFDDGETSIGSVSGRELSEELVAAESTGVDETFEGEEIELLGDDELELIEDDDIEVLGEHDHADESDGHRQPQAAPADLGGPSESAGAVEDAFDHDLVDDGELDDLAASLEIDGDLMIQDQDQDQDHDQDQDQDLAADENLDLDDASLEADGDLLLDGEDLDDLALDDDDLALDDDDLALDDAAGDDALDGGELMDMDELDDVELGDVELEAGSAQSDPRDTIDATDDPEMLGAIHFSEGETALAAEDWSTAIEQFELAYAQEVDVAELHANLAWARFKESDESADMADHALDLLIYAEEMNPQLDMIHAYRAAVLLSRGETDQARSSAQRALDINPYCDLAMFTMDKLN